MGRDRVYKKTGERVPVFNGDLVIILISIFSVIAGGYFYYYRSFESYVLSKRDLEEERVKLETIEIRLKKLKKEIENKKNYKEEIIEKPLKYFENIFEFKEKINDFLKSKEIEIISIAAQEKEDERVYLAYSLEGREEKFLEFLEELEMQHEALTLLNSPIRMTDKNLEIKIGGYFKEIEYLEENIDISRKGKIFSKRDARIEYYSVSSGKGIVILMKEGEYPKRIFVKEETEVEYGGEVYLLKIEEGGLKIR